MWRTPPEMRHWYQQYIFCITINSPYTLPNNRASAQPRNTLRASGAPRIALRLRETPLHDSPGLPCSIANATASQLPRKGGYPQLRGRGKHYFPDSSGDPSISHLGVNCGHRNVPRTFLCRFNDMPDSSGLGKPPSRTLLLSYVSYRTDPLLYELSTTDYSHVFLDDLCTLQRSGNTQ